MKNLLRVAAVAALVAASVMIAQAQLTNTMVTNIGIGTFANGNSTTPSVTFLGSTFDGFYWNSAGHVIYTSQGNQCCDFGTGITLNNTYLFGWANNASPAGGSGLDIGMRRAGAGIMSIGTAGSVGSTINVSALPVASACGAGSPAVVAGSTPYSGSVTVGTGGPLTCTITYGGTAFPVAPHCSGAVETTTAANTRAMGFSSSATVLTIVPSAAWADSSVVNWNCIGAR